MIYTGLFVVFSSWLGRVNGPLQTILLQSVIPFTLIFSKLMLFKKYTLPQMIGATFVMFGIIFSLVPLFHDLRDGTAHINTQAWWWPLIMILGMVPAAAMNIFQEKLQNAYHESTDHKQKRYPVSLLQAIESFFQVCCFIFILWLVFLHTQHI